MSNYTVESTKVETSDGAKLHTRLFKPREETRNNLVVVLVHPYSILGGCQGLLKGIAAGLAEKGYKAVTFDMRGAGKSTGRASLTGFAEIKDVIAVCKWACENLSVDRILLVGSSAGIMISFVGLFATNFYGSSICVYFWVGKSLKVLFLFFNLWQ
jgi:alpha/beta superfamily hydrolase